MLAGYHVILALHVLSALAAMVSFWWAVFLEKGGRRHRKVGRIFARTMLAMSGTGGLLALELAVDPIAFHPEILELEPEALARAVAGAREVGRILVGIALLAMSFTWFGLRSVSRREGATLAARLPDIAAAATLVGIGAGAVPLSRIPGYQEVDGIGIFLASVGVLQLRALIWFSRDRWLKDHLIGVLGAGTILNGAFATQVGQRLIPGLEGTDVFAPSIPVVIAGVIATAHAVGRFGAARPARSMTWQGATSIS